MADDGVLFEQFYVSAPLCSPLRAAALTGRFPARMGIHYWMSPHHNKAYGMFSLHAATRVEADDRSRLERLCRYVIRPPLAAGKLRVLDEETLRFTLKTPWSDGTTHLVLSPLELIEKLCQKLLRNYPDAFDGHQRLAMLRKAQGRFQEAADHYGKVLNMMNQNPDSVDQDTIQFITELRDQALEQRKA